MRLKAIVLSTLLLSLMTMAFAMQPIYSQGGPNGPRTDNLLIHIYLNPDAENYALEDCTLDINDWPLSKEWIDRWSADPNIQMRSYAEIGMMEFDLNNQRWPTGVTLPREYDPATGTYKHWKCTNHPKDDQAEHFRSAIAHLTDKDRYISEILKGYGYRMDAPMPTPALGGYVPPDIHIYPYDQELANDEFDAGGFVMGTTPNPYYNPDNPDSCLYMRIDPQTGEDLECLEMYVRIDDPNRRAAGELLRDKLREHGICVNCHITEKSVCYEKVMVEYDYHIYTGGWSLSADVDFLYWLWSAAMYFGGTETSYLGGIGWSLNYPGYCCHDFETEAGKILTATDPTEVREAVFEALRVFTCQVPIIPLWCSAAVKAYKTGWEGVVNEEGFGMDNYWTFLNMYKEGDDTIDWGFKSNLEGPHVISAEWLWDWNVLGLIYDSMVGLNPYNFAEDIGWLAETWETGTWDIAVACTPEGETITEEAMWVKFTLRPDLTFHDGTPVEVEDVAFSLEFVRDCGPGVAWLYSSAVDIHHITTDAEEAGLGPLDVKVYFTYSSFWMLHWAGGIPVINKDLWLAANTEYGWGYVWPTQYAHIKACQHIDEDMIPGDTLTIPIDPPYRNLHPCCIVEIPVWYPSGVKYVRAHIDLVHLEEPCGSYIEVTLIDGIEACGWINWCWYIFQYLDWDRMKVRDYHPWNDDVNDNGVMDMCEDGTGAWKYDSTERPEAISASTWVLLTANRDFYLTQEYVSDFLETSFHAIGDVNYDGVINILDLSMIARALGTDDTYPWGTGWDEYNPDTDIYTCISWPEWIIGDGKVDIKDLTTAAMSYGRVSG